MNVMITDISEDLDTTVQGVQVAITVFLLVMAALMIPGGKLTDRFGRKRCFTLGLVVYGAGALISAISPGLGILIIGNSILEGVGTALLIPPVYILTTLLFTDLTSRARAFGVISALGGIGAAAGPLIGGLITTAISTRPNDVDCVRDPVCCVIHPPALVSSRDLRGCGSGLADLYWLTGTSGRRGTRFTVKR
jgi:MFS family permease